MGLHARHIAKALERPERISSLNLSNYRPKLESIPSEIYAFIHLEVLDLSSNALTHLPDRLFSAFPKLSCIRIDHNRIEQIPDSIRKAEHLEIIHASNNRISILPPSIKHLSELCELDLSGNLIFDLPSTFKDLSALVRLNLSNNAFQHLPGSIGKLANLHQFDFSNQSQLKRFRVQVGQFAELKVLNLAACRLGKIGLPWQQGALPNTLNHIRGLKSLNLDQNGLKKLPDSWPSLSKLTHLSIQDNEFDSWPSVLNQIKKLKQLDLSGNKRMWKSGKMQTMPQLRELKMSRSEIEYLPAGILELHNLEILELQNNQLHSLPKELGSLNKLQKINLKNNPDLKSIKPLATLANLTYLDISETAVHKIPEHNIWESLFYLNIRETNIEQVPPSAGCWKDLKKLEYQKSLLHKADVLRLKRNLKDFNSLNLPSVTRIKFMALDQGSNPEKTIQFNLEELLLAANSNNERIRIIALLKISQTFRSNGQNELIANSGILISGMIHDKKEWINRLESLGFDIQTSISENTKYILVGHFPFDKISDSWPSDIQFLTVRDIHFYLQDNKENQPDFHEIESVRQLLFNPDPATAALGIQMIKSLNLGRFLISDLFFLYKKESSYQLRNTFLGMLELEASDSLIPFLRSDDSIIQQKTATKLTKTLLTYAQQGLDADRIASLCFKYFGTGQRYLFNYGNEENQKRHIEKQLHEGVLDLSRCGLRSIPKAAYAFADQIKSLNLSNNSILKLPRRIALFNNLEHLDLGYNKLQELPDEFGQLNSLKRLSLSGSRLKKSPDSLKHLQQLLVLSFRDSKLPAGKDIFSGLNQLQFLDLFSTRVKVLPESITKLKNLRYLNIFGHEFDRFPKATSQLNQLRYLDLRPHQAQHWKSLASNINWPDLNCLLFGNISFGHSLDPLIKKFNHLEYFEGKDVSHELQQEILQRKPGNKYCLHSGHVHAGFEYRDNIWKNPGFIIQIPESNG